MQIAQVILALALVPLSAAVKPVVVKGNAFFLKDSNERFYIRGLDYQPGGSSDLEDPLADVDICKRDIKYFKELGINTIRVYSVDNTADHDECMELLDEAGIYLIADVNIPHASISRDDPECSYNSRYLNEVFATVEMLAQYDNVLGFFAGNEVINDKKSTTESAPYVKAVVRDMKKFIKENKLREIPVGYSAADIEKNRIETAHYFNCGDDEMARVDMFGFNDYSWCGHSSYKVSGYEDKVKAYSNYSIPLFLSEFGCNEVNPRPFTEVQLIYSEKMLKVFSGGLVYEYSEEANKYGLVKIDGNNVTTNKDYDNLKKEFEKTKNPSGDGDYQSDLDYSECPRITSNWSAEDDIPDTPDAALEYINGSKTPRGNGFDASTQWACLVEGLDDDEISSLSGSRRSTSTRRNAAQSTLARNSNTGSTSTTTGNSDGIRVSAPLWTAIVTLFSFFF